MADLHQVVAAVATGALLTVATMLVFKLYDRRRTPDRQRMIDAAANSVVEGVETFRQQVRASLPEDGGSDVPTAVGAQTEVRSKAHLRMISGEAADAVTHPSTACNRSQSGSATRRRPVRESRP